MLFSSFVFILGFLPLVVVGYYLLDGRGWYRTSIAWLVLASLIYYGWWNPRYLALIVVSMAVNYALGLAMGEDPQHRAANRRQILILGVVFNLGLLGYFKYANFFVSNLNTALGSSLALAPIVLPLGISFFTFQQIAYLVDVYRRGEVEHDLMRYSLFVTFFPQLIAGPIVHHGEMLPQFSDRRLRQFNADTFAQGVTIFILGLFKKTVVADTAAEYVRPVFQQALTGAVTFWHAWSGALAYTVQLYYDFSGYSDMAIGLGLMFGITIPLNFNSPYKARNIIDFWRRWHMTLSRFLRDYLYFPLGGNRHGRAQRYRNLMITMVLGGLWHGAGWTFVAWGTLHGLYLLVNHAWQAATGRLHLTHRLPSRLTSFAAWLVTFVSVVVGWVVFRAETLQSAGAMFAGMAGLNGLGGFGRGGHALLLIFVLWYTLRGPNTIEIVLGRAPGAAAGRLRWQPSLRWSLAVLAIAITSFLYIDGLVVRQSEFLYFQF